MIILPSNPKSRPKRDKKLVKKRPPRIIQSRVDNLSRRAVLIYRKLLDGKFYPVDAKNTPKAMQELIDAGLVGTMGRVKVITLCYVPHASKPFVTDQMVGLKITHPMDLAK